MANADVYHVFKIPKRNGKFRTIEAPNDDLKQTQKADEPWLRETFNVSPFAHGFEPYRNTVTMAMPHVGKRWVACFDVKDFFPSIKHKNLCFNHKNTETVERLKKHFYDFGDYKGLRLPQGAPMSPLLSNIYLHRYDWTMAWIAHRFNCDYTRYADDIVFSGESRASVGALVSIGGRTLRKKYWLDVHTNKTKFMKNTGRQVVCGIVVNEKLNLERRWRKRLRAEIHQKTLNGCVGNDTMGRIAYENMVRNNTKEHFSSRDMCNAIIMRKKLGG